MSGATVDEEALRSGVDQIMRDALKQGLEMVETEAKDLAPVRAIFQQGRRSSKKNGPPTKTFGAGPIARTFSGENLKTRRGLALTDRGKITNKNVRGRPNSQWSVINTKLGRVGSSEDFNLRALRHGKLVNTKITRNINGKTQSLDLAKLVTSHAKYDIASGRAVHFSSTTFEEQAGGRLRDSITAGEVIDDQGGGYYGYVWAEAHDPGSSHNYAFDQEYGTRHHPAQPFLRPALRSVGGSFLKNRGNPIIKSLKRNFRIKGVVEIKMDLNFRTTGTSRR